MTAEEVTADSDLSNRVALVTGANSGIGLECSRVLALRGSTVYMGCRTEARAKAAAAEFGESASQCHPIIYDGDNLAGLPASVAGLPKFDYLFLNAGIFDQHFRLTEEGHEGSYAGNYLGHFWLVHQLTSLGKLNPGARIIATLSEAVHMNPFARADTKILTNPTKSSFSRSMASPNAKIMITLMLTQLAQQSDILCVGALPPGTLTNNVNTGRSIVQAIGGLIGPLIMKPVAEGAAPLLQAVISPDVKAGTVYFIDSKLKFRDIMARATDSERAREVWHITEQVLGLPKWKLP